MSPVHALTKIDRIRFLQLFLGEVLKNQKQLDQSKDTVIFEKLKQKLPNTAVEPKPYLRHPLIKKIAPQKFSEPVKDALSSPSMFVPATKVDSKQELRFERHIAQSIRQSLDW